MSALVNKLRQLKPAHLFTTAVVAAACAAPAQDLPSDDGDDTPTVHAGSSSGGSPASSAGTSALPTAGTSVVGNGGSGTVPKGGAPGGGGTATAGGTAASTGGSVAAAGTASSSTCPQYAGTLAKDSAIFVSGFGTATKGTWKGYGFTYKYGTATIAPGAGNGCFAAAKFCANGSVPASDESGAGLGWNLGQMMSATTTTPVAIATPVVVKFAGVTAGMRVQLSASATVSYCYTLTAAEATAGTATIPYASFKKACWDTATAVAYDGVVPIEAIQVAVPGSTAGAVQPFDFCLLDIEPG